MTPSPHGKKTTRGAIRWLLRETFGNLFLIALLFGIVGRLGWWNGWALSAIYILWSLGTAIFILPVNPQMLAERQLSGIRSGSKKWDMTMVMLMGVFMFATYILACLDVRNSWSPAFPLGLQIAALVVCFLGYDVLLLWSMVVNAFFTAIVRIQTERGHRVVRSGPYRFVRHPGYLGTILFDLFSPLVLGSLWALIPSVAAAIVLVLRTAREDETLQNELPGYREYTAETRFKLVPGIW